MSDKTVPAILLKDRNTPAKINTGSQMWQTISVGVSHVAAIRNDGILFTWGLNNVGQLGTGDTVYRSTITQIGSSSWTMVSAGNSYTSAIRQDGTLWSWGLNSSGQLGDGTTVNKSSPIQIGTLSWRAVAASDNTHTIAIRNDNLLFAWGGQGPFGQLGDGTTTNKSSPVQIGSSSWSTVSAGFLHNLATTTSGDLYAWGYGNNGELGNPALSTLENQWTDIKIGYDHVLALQNGTNKLYAWGKNEEGQLGDGTTIDRPYPVKIGDGSWLAISAGTRYSAAINNQGKLFTWGFNSVGQLGDATTIAKSSPVQIGASSWTAVSAGQFHTAAIRSGGTLFTWGNNNVGQLGDNTITNKSSPTVLASAPVSYNTSSWTAVSVGASFTMAIRSGGTLFTWGEGRLGQLGDNTSVNKSSPVQIGSSSWTAVSAGYEHAAGSVLVGSDNYLYIWGRATEGQLGIAYGMSVTSWTSVASGDSHTVAIRSDGLLFSWGLNSSGQLGDSTTTNRASPVQIGTRSWTAVASENNSSFAIRQDGYLYSWGLNASGQLGVGTTSNSSSPVLVGLSATSNNIAWKFGSTTFISTSAAFNSAMVGWAGSTWTMEAWIYHTASVSGASYPIMATYGCVAANGRWIFGAGFFTTTSTRLGFNYTTSTGTQVDLVHPSGMTINQWHHVALTMDSTTSTNATINLFVDGVINTWTAQNISTHTTNWTAPNIGRFDGCGATYNKSWISNLRIIKGQQLYTASFTPSVAGLPAASGTVILFTCNSNQITDKSPGNYVLTLSGSIEISEDNPFTTYDAKSNFISISTGGSHTVALDSNLSLFSWGLNNVGQLGDGTTTNKLVPTQIAGAWFKIAAGASHTTAITSDKLLFAWGLNSSGQLGDGTTFNKSTPVSISTSSWWAVSSGASHSAAIRSGGTLFTWGVNTIGQLGDGSTINRSSPVQIGTKSWIAVSTGNNFSMAIDDENKLYGWGLNNSGQIGNRGYIETTFRYDEGLNAAAYVQNWNNATVTYMDNFGFLGNGTGHGYVANTTFSLTLNLPPHNQLRYKVFYHFVDSHDNEANHIDIDGVRYASFTKSYNTDGLTVTLNNLAKLEWRTTGTNSGYSYHGAVAGSINGYVDIDTGWISHTSERIKVDHIWAADQVVTDEAIYLTHVVVETRIDNTDGTYLLSYTRPQAIGSSSWTLVSAGGAHTAALRSDSTLFTWGLNNAGQLAHGDILASVAGNPRNSPVQVGSTANVAAVSSPVLVGSNGNYTKIVAAGFQTAVTFNSNVLVTGRNIFGQLGTGDTLDRFTFTSLYPKQYQVYSFNRVFSNDASPLDDSQFGIGYDSINQLSYGWGKNDFGAIGDSTTIDRLSPVVIGQGGASSLTPVQIPGTWANVAAGYNLSIATSSTNYLFAWGLNNVGQIGDVSTVNKASPVQLGSDTWSIVAAGKSAAAAIKTNGTLWAWGLNNRGQLGDGTNDNRSEPVQIGTNSWTSVALGGNSFVSYGLS